MKKIVVTFTTIPQRLNTSEPNDLGLYSNLMSLLNQTYVGYELHLNIPSTSRYSGEEYNVPEWIYNLRDSHTNFKLFENLEDKGPVTKLLPTVRRVTDPETIIIVVDDDLVYHEDLVKEQINNQIKFEGCIVGYDGLRAKEHFFKDVRDHYFTSNYKSSRVDILQHYKSVSYKRSYFEEDFDDFVDLNFTWNDDLLISAYFSDKRRDRIATYHESDPEFKTLEEWQAKGGVATFPVLRHTSHGSYEGCNVYRQDEEGTSKVFTNPGITDLYKDYIDQGYKK